ERRARAVAAGLSLDVDHARLPLTIDASELSQPRGQGGLHPLRLAVRYTAVLPAGPADRPHAVTFADSNEPDRVGWREIVVTARGDARLLRSNAPARDRSDELRKYPADLIRSPLDLRQASADFTPGTEVVAPLPLTHSTV